MLASDGTVPLKGNLLPDETELRDLGSETLRYRRSYVRDIFSTSHTTTFFSGSIVDVKDYLRPVDDDYAYLGATGKRWKYLYVSRDIFVDGLVDGVDVSEHVINPDVHHKRLDIQRTGVLVGTRQTLNFSEKFIVEDDPVAERVNIDFSLVEPCDWVDFELTASGTIISAPATGYKIRLLAFYWSSDADIVTALRWGATGSNMFALPIKGIIGMNLIGRERDAPEATELYGYLSGAGTMRGSIGYKIVPV